MKHTKTDRSSKELKTAKRTKWDKKQILFLFDSHYESLTLGDFEFLREKGILNGCGGKGCWFKPPYRIFFETSCDIHDFTYWQGGDEAQRKNCDDGFLERMLKDADRCGFLTRWFYKLWARLYHKAVRKFGGKFYNYGGNFTL